MPPIRPFSIKGTTYKLILSMRRLGTQYDNHSYFGLTSSSDCFCRGAKKHYGIYDLANFPVIIDQVFLSSVIICQPLSNYRHTLKKTVSTRGASQG